MTYNKVIKTKDTNMYIKAYQTEDKNIKELPALPRVQLFWIIIIYNYLYVISGLYLAWHINHALVKMIIIT